MSGRMTLGSLFVLAALIPGFCHAQGGYGYGPPPQGAWQGQPPMPPASGYPMPPQGPSNTIYEQLPDDLGFMHEDSPLETALKNLFRHSYYRGEYLLWTASAPGNVLLGGTPTSPIPSTLAVPEAPNTYLINSNPLTGNPAQAIVPSTDQFQLKNINGFRGTMGLPIGPGNFELSAFILQNRKNFFDGTAAIKQEVPADLLSVPPVLFAIPATFIGQPVTIAGIPGNMLYTTSYQAIMQTSIWGTEANYILDAPNAGTGDILTFSPMLGFRYFNYFESLSQSGDFSLVTDPTTNPVTTVPAHRASYSLSNNNSYGPQFGVRVEATISKVTFGAEPKVMLGVNSYSASLSTINAPINSSNHTTGTTFAPIADLKVYTRINISQYAHVFAAYNLMWAGSISRPYDSIGYNLGTGGSGLFKPTFTDSVIEGLSVGAELRF